MRSLEYKFMGYFPNFDYYKSILLNGIDFLDHVDFPHILSVQVFGMRYSTMKALMRAPSRYRQYFPMKVRQVLSNPRQDLYAQAHFIYNYVLTSSQNTYHIRTEVLSGITSTVLSEQLRLSQQLHTLYHNHLSNDFSNNHPSNNDINLNDVNITHASTTNESTTNESTTNANINITSTSINNINSHNIKIHNIDINMHNSSNHITDPQLLDLLNTIENSHSSVLSTSINTTSTIDNSRNFNLVERNLDKDNLNATREVSSSWLRTFLSRSNPKTQATKLTKPTKLIEPTNQTNHIPSDSLNSINPNINLDINPEINSNTNLDLSSNINPAVNSDISQSPNPNINSNTNLDLNPNINPSIKPAINLNSNLDINPDLKSNRNSKPNTNPTLNPNSDNCQTQQIIVPCASVFSQAPSDFEFGLQADGECIDSTLPQEPLFGYHGNPKFDRYSVFMSQENIGIVSYLYQSIDGYVDYVDLSTGSMLPWQIVAQFNNYLHYPVYLTPFFTHLGMPTLQELRDFITSLNQKRNRSLLRRKYVSALVATHDEVGGYKGVRQQLLDICSQMFGEDKVLCPSKFNHNTEILKEEFNDDKNAFLENVIFNICPENTYTPGYITEKIIDCLMAGCIPIYWGGIVSEQDIFNLDAILYYNPRQPRAFAHLLDRFLYDDDFVAEFLDRPVFLPGAAERIFIRYFAPLLAKLERDINLTTKNLRVNSPTALDENYHWYNDYQQAQQTLKELGLVEDKYTYLINDRNYQWPFTKLEKYLVNNNIHLLHQQFPDQIVYNLGVYNRIPNKP